LRNARAVQLHVRRIGTARCFTYFSGTRVRCAMRSKSFFTVNEVFNQVVIQLPATHGGSYGSKTSEVRCVRTFRQQATEIQRRNCVGFNRHLGLVTPDFPHCTNTSKKSTHCHPRNPPPPPSCPKSTPSPSFEACQSAAAADPQQQPSAPASNGPQQSTAGTSPTTQPTSTTPSRKRKMAMPWART